MSGALTMSDARGYSYSLVKAIQAADPALLGVQLADYCLHHEIPVAAVARTLGVTRQTVYSWFTGTFRPRGEFIEKINSFMAGPPKAQA